MSIFYGGSRRSGIFSRRRRKRVRSEAERQVIFWWRVVITLALLLLLALVCTGIYKATRHESVTLTDVRVFGGETVDKDEVEHRAQELLKGTYLFLIPRAFAYLYPHDEIVEAISRIPRVRDVRVERTTPTGLEVRFNEYAPYALWCRSLDSTVTEPCLFVDRDGYAFGEAPQLSAAALVRLVTESDEPEIDTFVLPQETLRVYSEFVEALRVEESMRIYAITTTVDGDVLYHVNGGGDIMISADTPIQDVFDTLSSVLDAAVFQHLAPGNFEYIDLRFDNKVYVKEGSEDEAVEASGTFESGNPDAEEMEAE